MDSPKELKFTGVCCKGHIKIGWLIEDSPDCPLCKIKNTMNRVIQLEEEIERMKERLKDCYKNMKF